MNGLATSTVDVYRGLTTDDYGDTIEADNAAIHTGVVISLIENSRQVYDPADGEVRTVRYITGRCAGGTDIVKSDRLEDTSTGTIYLVQSARQPLSPVMVNDLVLDLKEVDQA